MSPVKNGRVLFVEAPTGYPEPGKHTIYDGSEVIDPDTVPLNGGILLKTLVVSIDPYIRGLMNNSYDSSYKKGEPVFNYGVGVVLRTENTSVKVGDHVYGILPFQEYNIFPDASNIPRFLPINNEHKLPWSLYVGVAGMPGQTSYVGWKEYADPQKGDVVFVTAGAGPVGSFVIQLAKQEGLKVVASAGSEEKIQFLKDIGVDVAFNYKTTSTADVLEKEGPINIYWDNVGGETLDAALANAAQGARFIECGMISTYNVEPPTMKNLMRIVRSELKIYGFVVSTLMPKYAEAFYAEVPKWIASKKIKYTEDIRNGLEHVGQAIFDVQTGKNVGKSVIIVGADI